MTLRHLKIFVTVCECGGITRAAEALHMVQPSVSYAISEMEKYYEIALFDRINQRLVLTDMGAELLIKAKEILASFDEFEEMAMQRSRNPSLRIGSSLTLGLTILPQYLKKLEELFPSVVPTVMVNKTATVEEALESGNLDFIMVEGDIHSPHLKSFPFGGDSIVAIAATDYHIPDSVTLPELLEYPLLLRETGSASRNLFEHEISLHHLTAKPFLESVSNECVISSAIAGLGVAILPDRLVANRLRRQVLKKIQVAGTDFQRTHFLAIHKNKKLNPLQKKAFDLCMTFGTQPVGSD